MCVGLIPQKALDYIIFNVFYFRDHFYIMNINDAKNVAGIELQTTISFSKKWKDRDLMKEIIASVCSVSSIN